jgi:hypothetical protein
MQKHASLSCMCVIERTRVNTFFQTLDWGKGILNKRSWRYNYGVVVKLQEVHQSLVVVMDNLAFGAIFYWLCGIFSRFCKNCVSL